MRPHLFALALVFTLLLSACTTSTSLTPAQLPAEPTSASLPSVIPTISPLAKFQPMATFTLPAVTQTSPPTCHPDSSLSFAYLPESAFIAEILPLTDGNFLLRGRLDNSNGTWLAKIDSAGQILWQNIYGKEWGDLRPGSNGSFVLGFSKSSMEIAADGSVVGNGYLVYWFQRNPDDSLTIFAGGKAARYHSTKDWTYSIANFGGYTAPASDGGAWFAYAGGYVDTSVYYAPQYTDIKVIKILPDGQVLQRVYGKLVGDETLDFFKPTSDGGLLLAGSHAYEELGSDYDVWLMKLNAGGGLSWQSTLKLSPHSETLHTIHFLRDGYLAIVTTFANDIPILVRLKSNGALAWQKAILSSRGVVEIEAVAGTSDGGLILAGRTWETPSIYWLARLDPKGNLLWEKTIGYYGIPDAPGTEIEAILPLENGEILLGGNTDLVGSSITAASSAWLARIPDSGSVLDLIELQPGKFTLISTLSSRPNTLPDEVLPSTEIFWNEMDVQFAATSLEPIPVCLPADDSFPTPAALPSLTPSATPTPSLARDLYLTNPPMQGDDVLKLQQRLLELGYPEVGTPDGIFGKMTEAAVRRFQEKNSLDVDGYVGPKTWQKLFSTDAVRGD